MTATLSNKKRRKFGRAAILPPNQRSVIQCTSTAGPGVTISYLTVTWRPYTATITGEDGTVTPQTNVELANLPTVTVVQSSAATVYAPPVNGYNIVKRQTGVSATDTTATTTLRTTPPPPPGEASNDMPTQESRGPTQLPNGADQPGASVAPGAIAGAVVGAVLGLGLLALGAFFVRQRYRHSAVNLKRPKPAAWRGWAGNPHVHGPSQGPVMSKMPADSLVYELQHGRYAYELPGGRG